MIQHIPFSLFKPMPWKNGRGTTLEIFKIEGKFRISQAKISEAGPFSFFPGMDRFILPLSGDGIILNQKRIQPLEIYQFSGDENTHCELMGGEVEDFNVIVNRNWGEARVELKTLSGNLTIKADTTMFIYEIKKAPELWVLEPGDLKDFFFNQEAKLIFVYLIVT